MAWMTNLGAIGIEIYNFEAFTPFGSGAKLEMMSFEL